jgi:hypothetical protein
MSVDVLLEDPHPCEIWVISYIRHGTLAYVDVAEGLESAPAVLIGLFHGRNVASVTTSEVNRSILVSRSVLVFSTSYYRNTSIGFA